MTLNGIDITGLIWIDRYEYSGIASEVVETLDGGRIVWESASISGQPVTLSGGDDYGWLTFETIKLLLAISCNYRAIYDMVTDENETIRVRFRHEAAPAISAQSVQLKAVSDDEDFYKNVTIKLATI